MSSETIVAKGISPLDKGHFITGDKSHSFLVRSNVIRYNKTTAASNSRICIADSLELNVIRFWEKEMK